MVQIIFQLLHVNTRLVAGLLPLVCVGGEGVGGGGQKIFNPSPEKKIGGGAGGGAQVPRPLSWRHLI